MHVEKKNINIKKYIDKYLIKVSYLNRSTYSQFVYFLSFKFGANHDATSVHALIRKHRIFQINFFNRNFYNISFLSKLHLNPIHVFILTNSRFSIDFEM